MHVQLVFLSLFRQVFVTIENRTPVKPHLPYDVYALRIALVTRSEELLHHELFIYEVINLWTISSLEINNQGHVLHWWNMSTWLWSTAWIKHPGAETSNSNIRCTPSRTLVQVFGKMQPRSNPFPIHVKTVKWEACADISVHLINRIHLGWQRWHNLVFL